ncbi:MAG: class II glutamine amidotransferase [Betaproteobacteria bacterium]|nr:class II glutamine amidotransferase [Betaproteobacteria bacterium]
MCELFGASSNTARGLSRWLVPFRARGGASANNPDGWGIAYGSGGQPNIEKSPGPGGQSQRFLQLWEGVNSPLVIAHVRKARHPPVPGMRNTHPFAHRCCDRDWVFAHNGLVSDIVDWPVANPLCHPTGDTDSEHAFCRILAGIVGTYDAVDHDPWLGRLEHIAGIIAAAGKFNFLLSDGRVLIAYGDDRLHYREESDEHGSLALVATEPLTDDAWHAFSPRQLRVYQDGKLLACRGISKAMPSRSIGIKDTEDLIANREQALQ